MDEKTRLPRTNRDIMLKTENDIVLLRGEIMELKVIIDSLIKRLEGKTNNGSWW